MERIDCIVVGAGVVGLAIARTLALRGREVLVLEAADAIGSGASSRNSEVIHAGIYYPAGSLKARLCVAGRDMLYAYLASRGVEHRRCGKLIVACEPGERAVLERLLAAARTNGVTDLRPLSREEARALEPELRCEAALLSPSTGILDSHGYLLALHGDAERAGASVLLRAPVLGGRVTDDGIEIDVGGADPATVRARHLVNAAGLHAPALARRIAGVPAEAVPRAYFAKGSYFSLSGRAPFSRLIYPAPETAGLGVHLTLDLAGRARFGPDVEWVDDPADRPGAYAVDAARADAFHAAIRRYWPGLPDASLDPDYAGIRPKLQAPGEAARDFLIQGEAQHGVPGLVQLHGIESPGLTASLAIAEHAARLLFPETPPPTHPRID